MQVEIREIGPGDEAAFRPGCRGVFRRTGKPVAAHCLPCRTRSSPVRRLDGEVVGQCAAVIHRHPDKATELYIDEVGVSPAFQRRGIARQMIERMVALGKTKGCEEVWVGTERDNAAARGLYEALDLRGDEAENFVMYVYYL